MTAPIRGPVNRRDAAPDETLLNEDGFPVRLSDEWRQAPVVRAFFPAALEKAIRR